MVVCVYGASSSHIDSVYMEKCKSLGKTLAKKGHSLVFGAGSEGLMGATARGVKEGGGKVHGVIPTFFEENGYEGIFYESDKITRTQTMAERKSIMENECQAFIIVPGGNGTFEEFFQALTLKQLGRHSKPIALFNVNGYFNKLHEFFSDCVQKGFIRKECAKLYKMFDDENDLIDYVENYKSQDVEWSLLKKN